MRPIYLDYAATTPVDPRVAKKMFEYLTIEGDFGNPSSPHFYGLQAKEAVELARKQVADLISAESSEIIWTSGATEANNLALKGAAELYQKKGKHIITLKTEHPSVLDCCQYLEKKGFQLTYLTPNKNGLLNMEKLEEAIRPDTILISVMHVNNEVGIIQNISEIGKVTSSKGILFHVDAVQSAGKIPINVNEMHIDLMSLSAHKIYGPKGIGALYVRKKPRIRVAPIIIGGGQESGMRSGTLATHQIVGMGEAFYLAKNEMQEDYKKMLLLREKFLQGISANKKISLNTDIKNSIPNILSLLVKGMKAEDTMKHLPELAISSGSACSSKGTEPSYVLRALGLSFEQAQNSVRVSFGRFTTKEELDLAIVQLQEL